VLFRSAIALPCVRGAGAFWRAVRALVVLIFRAVCGPLAACIYALVNGFIYCAAAVNAAMPASKGPIWPTVRFVCAAILHGQVKKFLLLIVLLARWRVILCLANCNDLLAWPFYPFVFVARKLLHWNAESWILGCACGRNGRLSLLSYVPVTASDYLVQVVNLVRLVPLLGPFLAPIGDFADYLKPVLSFTFDFLFSVGVAEGFAMVVDRADEQTHSKLVWMSMNVSKMIREGPLEKTPLAPTPCEIDTAPIAEHGDSTNGASGAIGGAPGPSAGRSEATPEWREDGIWSLF